MFVWTAVDVDDQLASLKKKAKLVEENVQFLESGITLPLHVSLKISFYVPDERLPEVVDDLTALLEGTKPFGMATEKLELHETIAWLKVTENPQLTELHQKVCKLSLEKYQAPLHEYDKDFLYHITVFLDSDTAKVKEAFLQMLDTEYPSLLKANQFVIGCSPEGAIGTYRVLKTIALPQ